MAKSAQRQFLVSVSGIRGYWATKSGGGITSETNKVWNGGDLSPDTIAGPAEVENITVSRPYGTIRETRLLRRLRRRVGSMRATITVTPTNGNLVATGRSTVYPRALLVSVKEPEVDASSSDAATIELEFAIGRVR